MLQVLNACANTWHCYFSFSPSLQPVTTNLRPTRLNEGSEGRYCLWTWWSASSLILQTMSGQPMPGKRPLCRIITQENNAFFQKPDQANTFVSFPLALCRLQTHTNILAYSLVSLERRSLTVHAGLLYDGHLSLEAPKLPPLSGQEQIMLGAPSHRQMTEDFRSCYRLEFLNHLGIKNSVII